MAMLVYMFSAAKFPYGPLFLNRLQIRAHEAKSHDGAPPWSLFPLPTFNTPFHNVFRPLVFPTASKKPSQLMRQLMGKTTDLSLASMLFHGLLASPVIVFLFLFLWFQTATQR